jgi:hypothetical protein
MQSFFWDAASGVYFKFGTFFRPQLKTKVDYCERPRANVSYPNCWCKYEIGLSVVGEVAEPPNHSIANAARRPSWLELVKIERREGYQQSYAGH